MRTTWKTLVEPNLVVTVGEQAFKLSSTPALEENQVYLVWARFMYRRCLFNVNVTDGYTKRNIDRKKERKQKEWVNDKGKKERGDCMDQIILAMVYSARENSIRADA